MSTSRRTQLLIGTALAALAATGCSKLPTQPIVEATGSGASPGMMVASQVKPGFLVQPPPAPGTGSRATVRILGKVGGSATNGVFTVVIPAGTFTGQATVTVTQPDNTVPLVQLDIQPASKNHFKKPVTLVAQFQNVDASRIAMSTVSELDPTTGAWSLVGGSTADPMAGTVRATLAHFSTYRVDLSAPLPISPGPGSGGGKSGY
jgi:hypothetical protein